MAIIAALQSVSGTRRIKVDVNLCKKTLQWIFLFPVSSYNEGMFFCLCVCVANLARYFCSNRRFLLFGNGFATDLTKKKTRKIINSSRVFHCKPSHFGVFPVFVEGHQHPFVTKTNHKTRENAKKSVPQRSSF